MGEGERWQGPVEERLAHLDRAVEDLSDIVTAQADEIARLRRQVDALRRREAEREADADTQIPLGDQRPPHW